jgi:hypothetical protein
MILIKVKSSVGKNLDCDIMFEITTKSLVIAAADDIQIRHSHTKVKLKKKNESETLSKRIVEISTFRKTNFAFVFLPLINSFCGK